MNGHFSLQKQDVRLPDDVFRPFRQAWSALLGGGAVYLLSVASIGLALLLVGLFTAGRENLEYWVELAGTQSEVTVYLVGNLEQTEIDHVQELLSESPGVLGVEFVNREQAMRQMKETLGPDAERLLQSLDMNPFAAYLAVRVEPDRAEGVVRRAESDPSVEHVQDNRVFLARLAALSRTAEWVGNGLVALAGLVAMVVISHVIRLGMHERREEMETLRLMGASERFVRSPFLLEGLLVGGLGAVLAIAVMAIALPLMAGLLSRALPFMPLAGTGGVFGGASLLVAILGLACGGFGSWWALHDRRVS